MKTCVAVYVTQTAGDHPSHETTNMWEWTSNGSLPFCQLIYFGLEASRINKHIVVPPYLGGELCLHGSLHISHAWSFLRICNIDRSLGWNVKTNGTLLVLSFSCISKLVLLVQITPLLPWTLQYSHWSLSEQNMTSFSCRLLKIVVSRTDASCP